MHIIVIHGLTALYENPLLFEHAILAIGFLWFPMGLGIAFHGVLLQWIIDVASLVSSSNGHESLARRRKGWYVRGVWLASSFIALMTSIIFTAARWSSRKRGRAADVSIQKMASFLYVNAKQCACANYAPINVLPQVPPHGQGWEIWPMWNQLPLPWSECLDQIPPLGLLSINIDQIPLIRGMFIGQIQSNYHHLPVGW